MASRLKRIILRASVALALISGAKGHAHGNDFDAELSSHLDNAIHYYRELQNYIPETEASSYLSLLASIANCTYDSQCSNGGKASNLIGLLLAHGTFGPPDIKMAVEYLEQAIQMHGEYDAASYLGWLYLDHPEIRDEEKAIDYLLQAISKASDVNKVYAYNFMGNLHVMSKRYRDAEKAKSYYLQSFQLSNKLSITNHLPAENLSRIFLYGSHQFPRDLKQAAYFSDASVLNGGHLVFQTLINNYPIDATTSYTQLLYWLEEIAASGDSDALLELALFNEHLDNQDNYLKWFTLCAMLCEENQRYQANSKIKNYGETLNRSTLDTARRQAGDWFGSRYRPINLTQHNQSKNLRGGVDLSYDGKLVSLLIGVEDYNSDRWHDLETPSNDIELLERVMRKQYDAEVITMLNPTKQELENKIHILQKDLEEGDNLLIYFAGHGQRSADGKEGYWILSDGNIDQSTWLKNSWLKDMISSFEATNILLVSDSCFSGLLTMNFRSIGPSKIRNLEQSYPEFLRTKSVVAISSGGVEPVLDGGAGENSVFALNFAEYLEKQDEPFTASQLHSHVSPIVTGIVREIGYKQTPWIGDLKFEGHRGPDFIFIPHRTR